MTDEEKKKLKRMNESAFGWTTSIFVSAVTAILTTLLFQLVFH